MPEPGDYVVFTRYDQSTGHFGHVMVGQNVGGKLHFFNPQSGSAAVLTEPYQAFRIHGP